MFSAIIPLVMAVLGALIYILASRPTFQELGRLLFAAGVFALAFALSAYKFAV